MTKRKLLAVSVFYRNNVPGGLGFTLTEDLGSLEQIIEALSDHYEKMYRQAVQRSELKQFIEDLFAQLDQLGQRKESLPLRDLLIATGNVMLLEKYGFIKGDEFNGMQYCYIEQKSVHNAQVRADQEALKGP